MEDIYYVSDFFDTDRGGETVDANIVNYLNAIKLLSKDFTGTVNGKLIISNCVQIPEQILNSIKQSYIVIEHDYKFAPVRNPRLFPNDIVPQEHIQNIKYYTNADTIFCQSDYHLETIKKNISNVNLVSLKSSIWNKNELDYIESLYSNATNNKYAICYDSHPFKGMDLAIDFCKKNKLAADIIPVCERKIFLETLAEYNGLIFFPRTPETLCKLAVEAKLLGLEVITSNNYGASTSEFWLLEREDMLSYLRRQSAENLTTITQTICS
jgi:hypothetical protein